MDLSTVKEKLNGNKYLSPLEFKRDMLLIFSNALRYNGPAHPISRLAVKLKASLP